MNQTKLSRLEAIVAEQLTIFFPENIIVPQARVIKRTKKTRYEIDFYLPELSLGFEVQDFATHSRTETKSKNPWGKPMKGPLYHEMKRNKALTQLSVTIVELWEDEILSGEFVNKIKEAPKQI